jgi:hypothetical protein
MKRIDVEYGGQIYRTEHHDVTALQNEIAGGIRSGSYWLEVSDTEGQGHTAYLHLSSGVTIAVVPIQDENVEKTD